MFQFTEFYLNGAKNNEGFDLDSILSLSDQELEQSHTVIQWMFPLNEKSHHSLNAPVLTLEEFEELKDNGGWEVYMRAVDRFMKFLGMEKYEDSFVPAANFEVMAQNWLHPRDHNMKRITRMIRCAALLGKPQFAQVLCNSFGALTKHPFGMYNIEIDTIRYWQNAVSLPIEEELNTRRF